MERTYTVLENVSSIVVTVELAPSSGTLLDNITLTVSSVGGSATGFVLIIVYIHVLNVGLYIEDALILKSFYYSIIRLPVTSLT